jgi:hypothetical protein
MLSAAFDSPQGRGMQGFLDKLASSFGELVEEPVRGWILANDAAAVPAAWHSAM